VAARAQVSRKFLYRQKRTAETALNQAFVPAQADSSVLFHLPVTAAWLDQLLMSLVLICHSSYQGVIRLLQDLFDTRISLGDIHNLIKAAAQRAGAINAAQDLSPIRVGLYDEIFQGSQPVLAGADSASTYCYLLVEANHRDGETWGVHLSDAKAQGFTPDYTIADAGAGLRAGLKVPPPAGIGWNSRWQKPSSEDRETPCPWRKHVRPKLLR